MFKYFNLDMNVNIPFIHVEFLTLNSILYIFKIDYTNSKIILLC